MIISPHPKVANLRYHHRLSLIAADRIYREITARGFSAIYADSREGPESCILVNRSDNDLDLNIHVWVQAVNLPLPNFPTKKVMTYGGMSIYNSNGEELSKSFLHSESPDKPTNEFYFVADPGSLEARKAADEFGAYIIGEPGRFSEKLNKIFEEMNDNRDSED